MDANVFPSLATRAGCQRLMVDIARRSGFVPQATWLLEYWPQEARRPEMCGTIQGVADDKVGAIQNVGITPAHRGHGLGTVLLWHSLAGFREAGMERVYLEVTAQNAGACRLYQRLGFRRTLVSGEPVEACALKWGFGGVLWGRARARGAWPDCWVQAAARQWRACRGVRPGGGAARGLRGQSSGIAARPWCLSRKRAPKPAA